MLLQEPKCFKNLEECSKGFTLREIIYFLEGVGNMLKKNLNKIVGSAEGVLILQRNVIDFQEFLMFVSELISVHLIKSRNVV